MLRWIWGWNDICALCPAGADSLGRLSPGQSGVGETVSIQLSFWVVRGSTRGKRDVSRGVRPTGSQAELQESGCGVRGLGLVH